MSLFGSSPPDDSTPARSDQKSSLFDDEQRPSDKSGNSLFDDEAADGDSPWGMPTPKKASKSEVVKTLLPAPDVPESYIDAFDALADSGHKSDGGKIDFAGASKVFEGSGIGTVEQDRLLKLVTGGQQGAVGRGEFNVLLALIGLSRDGEEASLDAVDERRRSRQTQNTHPQKPGLTSMDSRPSRAISTLPQTVPNFQSL